MINIEGIYYEDFEGVLLPITEAKSSREKSWITLAQLEDEYPEFINKIAEVLFEPLFSEQSKSFARSILNYLYLWKWVSWKQFDSIMLISSTYQEYKDSIKFGTQFKKYGNILTVKRNRVSFTVRCDEYDLHPPSFSSDRDMDRLHKQIFGVSPMFEEEAEDGMSVAYRSDGSRYFALPTGDEQLSDYMHFGISFKGLHI